MRKCDFTRSTTITVIVAPSSSSFYNSLTFGGNVGSKALLVCHITTTNLLLPNKLLLCCFFVFVQVVCFVFVSCKVVGVVVAHNWPTKQQPGHKKNNIIYTTFDVQHLSVVVFVSLLCGLKQKSNVIWIAVLQIGSQQHRRRRHNLQTSTIIISSSSSNNPFIIWTKR